VHEGTRTEASSGVLEGKSRAAAYGGFVGSVAGALAMLAIPLGPLHLQFMGTILRSGTPGRGLVLFGIVGLLLAVAYRYTAAGFVGRGSGFVRRSATTGLVFGAIGGGLFSLFAVPSLVSGFPLSVPLGNKLVVLPWAVFGFAMGATYAWDLSEEPLLPAVLRRSGTRALASALAGVYVGGLALLLIRPLHLRYVGTIGLSGTPQRGLFVLLLLGLVLVFAVSRFAADRAVRAPVSTGVFAGIITSFLALFVLPVLVGAIGGFPLRVPIQNGPIAFGYFLFGLATTAVYGALRRTGVDLLADVRTAAFAKALPIATGVGGLAVYVADGAHLQWIGTLLRSGTVARGFVAWFFVAAPIAVLFAAIAGRKFDARTDLVDASSTGLLYGLGFAIVAGAALVPTLINGVTPNQAYPAPYVGGGLLGYVVFGAAFGAAYRASLPTARPGAEFEMGDRASVASRARKAVLFGSVFGGLVGGLLIHHLGGAPMMRFVGDSVGFGGSIATAWAAWLGMSVVLGGLFGLFVRNKLDDYVNSLIMTSSRNEDLRPLLQPALKQASLTTTAAGVGLAYGVALAVVLGVVGIPLLVSNIGSGALTAPLLDPGVFLGFVCYGGFLGLGYGVIMEF
jgi:hypothetical protein